MDHMHEVAQSAIAQIPPACRFSDEHAKLIHGYKELLLSLEAEVIQGFYDTLYAHPATSVIFVEGERPARELTLSHWWRRTVNGPINDQYWAWMAMVGLVHINRRVSNAMMLSMAGYVTGLVADRVETIEMNRADADHLVEAFRRLASTAGAIITYGYDQAYNRAVMRALDDVAGMPEALFNRLRDNEVSSTLAEARAEQARRG
jgi:hypothetical protein